MKYFNAQNIKAVLFDLDGTLLDTAPDLAQALNFVLNQKNLPSLPLDLIRPEAGHGCKGLLKLGLNIDDTHPEYPFLSTELLKHYDDHVADRTLLFAGMNEVLTHLETLGLPWGIVTNKPTSFTSKLLEKLALSKRAACIISGDTLSRCKPHPDPIIHACGLLKLKPAECLYIGDSEVDVLASKAAGLPNLVALYGYIPSKAKPQQWNADGYISHPLDIIKIFPIKDRHQICRSRIQMRSATR